MKVKRISEEEAYIQQKRYVTIDELCEKFDVSMSTMRRDLDILTQKGKIIKNYGGISSAQQGEDVGRLPFNQRGALMLKEKKRIAKAAAVLIHDGDYIFIDSGSTVCHLVDYIKDRRVTILTNNLDFIIRALPYPNLQIIVFSGILNRDYYSFTSVDDGNAEILKSFNFTKAFMAATGITVQYGIMNSLLTDNRLKVAAVERAQEVYLLADHTKFGRVTIKSYGKIGQMSAIITDQPAPPDIGQCAREEGCRIIIADEGKELDT